ncbi:MAG: hypothetical protein ABIH42_03415 [Planctomycetota bacterium]
MSQTMKEILTTTSNQPPVRIKKGYTHTQHHPEYDFMLPYNNCIYKPPMI